MPSLRDQLVTAMVEAGAIEFEPYAVVTELNEIAIPPTPPYLAIQHLAHEAGHILAKSLTADQVLTPDEVRKTRIELTTEEQVSLFLAALWGVAVVVPDWVVQLTNKLVVTYAKNNTSLEHAKIFPVSKKEFSKIVKKLRISTIRVDENNVVHAISHREGRNEEIPAMATERAVLEILKNSCPIILRVLLQVYEKAHAGIRIPNTSHGRAKKIVDRMYKRKRK